LPYEDQPIQERWGIVRQISAVALAVVAMLLAAPVQAADSLDKKIDKALAFSQIQLDKLAQRVEPRLFTSYTDTTGKWRAGRKGVGDWSTGFPAGMMWMMYEYTGDEKWADYGRDWTNAVRARATASDNDTGFQIYCSYGYGLRHAAKALSDREKRDYESVIRWGSETFTTQRYNANVGGYRSWPESAHDAYAGEFEVNIDEMMNLELPTYVAKTDGNNDLLDKVMRHSETTWSHHIYKAGDAQWEKPTSVEYVKRKPGGHYHVVEFDPGTGDVTAKRTAQGYKTESTWSRGQSWAVYAYTMLYRYTGKKEMLQRAEYCFDFFMSSLKSQSDNYIAYTDFDAEVSKSHPLDTSASAIVASAAVELYRLTSDKKYLDAAEGMLNDLTSRPYLAEGSDFESILTRGSQAYDRGPRARRWGTPPDSLRTPPNDRRTGPNDRGARPNDPDRRRRNRGPRAYGPGQELGTMFGDFYFVEALLRYKQLKKGE
jgi:unsaturated chondroitin disaccharide hydrolase